MTKVEEEWFQMILGIDFGPLMHILTHTASSHIGPRHVNTHTDKHSYQRHIHMKNVGGVKALQRKLISQDPKSAMRSRPGPCLSV